MSNQSPEPSRASRAQLVEEGFTVVPGVMPASLVEQLGRWSAAIFDNATIDHAFRFQGSTIFVHAPRAWSDERGERSDLNFPDVVAEQIIDLPAQAAACRQLGLEQLRADDVVIILSKPGHGPPLYWHQDYMKWHSPEAATPWPTRIFLSYYLTDTNRQNGCLRVIPGSHRTRHKLHDILPDAHGTEIQAIEDLSHPAFSDYPEAVDLPVCAGDLVICDARILHAAWPNQTSQRRTLLLSWHDVFDFPKPPSWWDGPIPEVVVEAGPGSEYERCDEHRRPGEYLR